MKNSSKALKKRNKLKREWFAKLKDTDFPREVLRLCKDCGREKMCEWNSSFTQTGSPEYRAVCKRCDLKRKRERSKKNRRSLTIQKRHRSRNNKKKCVDYLGGKCIECGYNKSLYALTFHHRIPKEKNGTIGTMLQDLSFNNKKLIDELNKCDLLCFNCHMEIHGEENDVK